MTLYKFYIEYYKGLLFDLLLYNKTLKPIQIYLLAYYILIFINEKVVL